MNVLVTGASGFIGRHLVPVLLDAGLRVTILSRRPAAVAALPWRARVRVCEGDLRQSSQLLPACQGQDAVIHCAGFAHANDDAAAHRQINYQGTLALLEAAEAAGVPRFLFLSSSKAAKGAGAYGHAKRQAEESLLEAHRQGRLQAACLRPAAVYGPGMKGNLAAWIRAIGRGLAPPLPPVSTRIAMIGVQDLASAILVAVRHEGVWGRIPSLSDGRPYAVKAMETHIRACLGKAPARWHAPRPLFYLAAQAGELLGRAGLPAGLGRKGYNVLFRDDYAEDPEFYRLTGFQAQQDFYTELPEIIRHMDMGS